MTSMLIPWISRMSGIGRSAARGRRSRTARRFEWEPLEVRTALSTGLSGGLPAIASAEVAQAARLVEMLKAAGVDLSVTTPRAGESSPAQGSEPADVLPLSPQLLDGLVASIGLLGSEYLEGTPIPVIVNSVASATGSTPSAEDIVALGRVAEAEIFTVQGASVALPDETITASELSAWLPTAVDQIKALAATIGPTSPDQTDPSTSDESSGDPDPPEPGPGPPLVPRGLIQLGQFFLANMSIVYTNFVDHFDSTSDSTASADDDIDADGVAPVSDSTAAAVQGGPALGCFGAGWTSVMTAGGSGIAVPEGSSSPGEGVLSTGGSDDQVQPASITAGEIPLDILLSDPVSPTREVSVGLQQYAELIPGAESSLALVATLWSVPSDHRWERSDRGDPSSEREESVPPSASPAAWAAFVIGLDESFERGRDACGKALSDEARKDREGAGSAAEERLDWRCPIIVAPAERGPFDRATPSSKNDLNRPLLSRLSGNAEWVARPGPEDGSPRDAGEGQHQTEASLPLSWAASGSAVFAGWLWARRRLRPGGGRGGIGRESPRGGRRDRFEDEGC
jgi:hypothetical protein